MISDIIFKTDILKLNCISCTKSYFMTIKKLENNYENRYVANILNFKVILSILMNLEIAENDEIIKVIKYITGKEVDDENKIELIEMCKKYLFEKHEYLKYINNFIDNDTSKDVLNGFCDLMSNIRLDISKIRPIGSYCQN